MAMPLGSGALAGLNWDLDRDATAARARLRAPVAELDRRGLQPRLRARLPVRRPPSARRTSPGSAPRSCSGRAASSASASPPTTFSSGSSIMPQKKNPDAAELLRAKAPACRRLADDPARRPARACRSPTARTSRRTRSRCSTPSTRSSSASRRRSGCSPGLTLRPRPAGRGGGRRDARGDRHRRPARPQGDAVPRGARGGRRPGPRRDRVWRAALRARPRGARRSTPELLDDEYYEVLREGAWLDSKRLGGRHLRGAPRRAARGRRQARSTALRARPP